MIKQQEEKTSFFLAWNKEQGINYSSDGDLLAKPWANIWKVGYD